MGYGGCQGESSFLPILVLHGLTQQPCTGTSHFQSDLMTATIVTLSLHPPNLQPPRRYFTVQASFLPWFVHEAAWLPWCSLWACLQIADLLLIFRFLLVLELRVSPHPGPLPRGSRMNLPVWESVRKTLGHRESPHIGHQVVRNGPGISRK